MNWVGWTLLSIASWVAWKKLAPGRESSVPASRANLGMLCQVNQPTAMLGTGASKHGTIADYLDHLQRAINNTNVVHGDLSQGGDTSLVVKADTELKSPFDVLTLQRDLNVLGATPALKEDGSKGAKTTQAVSDFQSHAGLPATGQVDPMTASAIRRSVAGVLTAAGESADLAGGQSAVTGFFKDFGEALGLSSCGMTTVEVQTSLNALGADPALNVDGIFGVKTTEAVKSFQMHQGLKQDGIVGPETASALRYFVAAVNPHLQQYVDVTGNQPQVVVATSGYYASQGNW